MTPDTTIILCFPAGDSEAEERTQSRWLPYFGWIAAQPTWSFIKPKVRQVEDVLVTGSDFSKRIYTEYTTI